MASGKSTDYYIHPTAFADEGCRIGSGTRVWHFCHIMPGAEIGNKCILGQNVFVGPGVSLGNGVKAQNNVSIYDGVTCEDYVFIGPSAVFTNVLNPRSEIERKEAFRKTLVKKGATIGANATILCGNTLGNYAFIAAGAVVLRDVKDYELVAGNPARHKGWMSKAGIKLLFDEQGLAVCPETNEKYRLNEDWVVKIEE